MGNIHTTGPNKALIISGGCFKGQSKKIVVGSWAWSWWYVTNVQYLNLNLMTIEPCCYDVETALGVPLSVTGVAHCKILRNPDLMMLATEQFLGKEEKEVRNTILQTLEGHLCAILGTMTVEEIYKDLKRFAEQVYEVAKPDVGRMGIEILSFTIKNVFDNVEYLSSLGKSQVAKVIKDAAIAVANSKRDAFIVEAECLKVAMHAKFETAIKIEEYKRAYKLQVAEFEKEVNMAKAQAQFAYQLEVAKLNQKSNLKKSRLIFGDTRQKA